MSDAVSGSHNCTWLLYEILEAGLKPGLVVGMDGVEERASQQVRRRVAQEPACRWADVADHPIPPLQRDHVGAVIDEGAKALLAAAQLLLGPLALGELHLARLKPSACQGDGQLIDADLNEEPLILSRHIIL